jgi:ribosomal-protein-alanine N-acetyltransferase
VTTGVLVDGLTAADADACARLEALLFPGDDPWPAPAFEAELRAGYHYLAARDPATGALVGYAGIALLPGTAAGGAEAEVHTIGVDPGHQGAGVGRALLEGLLTAADALSATVYLEVRTDNEAALALYRSEGFAVVGTRRRYYASGADAHTMARPARTRPVPPSTTPGGHPR